MAAEKAAASEGIAGGRAAAGERTYTVPRAFGTRTILGATGLVGLSLAGARWIDVSLVAAVFYAVLVASVSLAQMACQRAPRAASIGVGAVYLPLIIYGGPLLLPASREALLEEVLPGLDTDQVAFWLVVIGGLLGYLSGTLLAGLFMLLEWITPAGRRAAQRQVDDS